MVTVTLKCLFLATALLSAKAARPAEVVKSDVTPQAAALSVSDTAVHMATASALLQEYDLSSQANKDVARGAMPDGDSDGQNGAEDRANPVDEDGSPGANSESEAEGRGARGLGPAGQVEGQGARGLGDQEDPGSDVSGEEPRAMAGEAREGAVHIPPVISDSMVPTSEEIESKDLFKRTAEESKNLQEAAHGIDSTIHRVDQAIQKVYGATDKYHQSINSLTGQFGKLKDMSTDVHTEVLSEFKDRESDRMCAFENVERMLRGEPFQHCNTASAPANGDYRSNFASSVQQPRDEKLSEEHGEAHSEEHPPGSPQANAVGGAPLEGMPGANGLGRPPQGVGSEDLAKPHGASPGLGGRNSEDMSM